MGARLEAPCGALHLAVAGGTTVATISSLLADHVSLQVRSVDRLFLQGYVPRLMTEGQVIRFLLDRGFPIPSPAVLGKIGRGYVNQINEYIARNEIPTVKFVKGDVKEEIAREHFATAESRGALRGGDGRDRAGEDKRVARVARRWAGRASALRLSPPVDLPEQLLLLHPRSGLGTRVPEDRRRTPHSRYGSISTGTSGPNNRPPSRGSDSARWITGSRPARTRRRSPGSARACPPRMSAPFFDRWRAALPSPVHRRGPPPWVRL